MNSDDYHTALVSTEGNELRQSKLRDFFLEPALLLLFFGYNISATILPNVLLKQTCLYDGYSAENCSKIGDNNDSTKEIEDEIQPKVAKMMMVIYMLHTIIPAIISLFLGPWSDKYGRKTIIVATSMGFTTTLTCFYLVAVIAEQVVGKVNPWIFLLPIFPMILVGGWPTLVLAVMCYATDLTEENESDDRSSRYLFIEIVIFLGAISGSLSSSFILNLTNVTTVFAIGLICSFIATIYIILFVNESLEDVDEASIGRKFCELTSSAPVIDMLKTCFKERLFGQRKMLWGLIIISMLTIFQLNGISTVFYLFVREKFQWNLRDATIFDATSNAISISGCLVGIALFKKMLKISDMNLIFLAFTSAVVDSIIKAAAQTTSTMYLATSVSVFKVLASPMCRSVIGSIIISSDIGKVFAFTSAVEAISSLVASPLYTYVYSITFSWFSSAVFLLSAGIFFINLIIAAFVNKIKRQIEDLEMD